MIPLSLATYISSPSDELLDALLADENTVFWVDWREYDESIPMVCEGILNTGKISAEWIKSTNGSKGDESSLLVIYGERRVPVVLQEGSGTRHNTLLALNEALKPDFEVRWCIDSDGGDTLAFLPLRVSDWEELELRYGERIRLHFAQIKKKPNLFTD